MAFESYRRFTSPQVYRTLPDAQALKLGTASVAVLGDRLRVICWNVFKVARAGALADLAALTADADLVLLQEAVLHGAQPHVMHLTSGLEWVMAQTAGHAYRAITTGPKTGCRAPAIEMISLRTLDHEPIVRTPKASLLTRYPTATGTLAVVNVHAMNFVPLAKFARQIAQISQMMEAEKGPMLVGGDFNTWNPSRVRLVMSAMEKAGMTRVPVTVPRRWRHLGQQLDHVFTRGLKLIDARPLPHVVSSDHIPLRMEFAWE